MSAGSSGYLFAPKTTIPHFPKIAASFLSSLFTRRFSFLVPDSSTTYVVFEVCTIWSNVSSETPSPMYILAYTFSPCVYASLGAGNNCR
ncbi:ORF260 [White spot syndrome virus]|uniref:ORF260 n=1 Tax=White spot syndrome virus TaxID=342409 RepID=A0A2D3I5S7_9VIRU|nr:ORF260 [White spot syndrome virus]